MPFPTEWASCQIRKIAGCACAGNAGNVFPRHRGSSDPDMHHGTCVTHVPWCMPGSLTSNFLWGQWRGKHSRHSRRMRKPQFYVSDKRPMFSSKPKVGTPHWYCLWYIKTSGRHDNETPLNFFKMYPQHLVAECGKMLLVILFVTSIEEL